MIVSNIIFDIFVGSLLKFYDDMYDNNCMMFGINKDNTKRDNKASKCYRICYNCTSIPDVYVFL
jgi:hypothetical protein